MGINAYAPLVGFYMVSDKPWARLML
ncbi:uncharacterized protein G2W53_007989 [Senna tora]|uniref:Uncharacterized protein n=1 Tax=Senna tora TaxID=362788 RepID=A0A835CHR7_9FABA|nr:uncharacterized protein G2W53_007989 [Senna tora]